METKFVSGEIVYLDNDQTVLFTIVHIDEDHAWIKPFAHTGEHKHFEGPALGLCKCSQQHLVHTCRLWLKITNDPAKNTRITMIHIGG